jgi:hypothetical protein
MEDWSPSVLSKPWSMLAMDEFHRHVTDRLINRLRNRNTVLVIIPRGVKSQLQLFYVSLNKPFEHLVCKHYDAWLNKDKHTLTPSGIIKTSSASIIVEWILKTSKDMPNNNKMIFSWRPLYKVARVLHMKV